MKTKPAFATEAELCAAFLSMLPKGWTPYAETAGWDILLSRDSDGLQIGIEAKLRLNATVLNQAIEDGRTYSLTSPGPDCRAVLVPDRETGDLDRIAAAVGITVIRMRQLPKGAYGPSFLPQLPSDRDYWYGEDWFECCPTKRHELPEYVPDVVAGSPAPVQLTKWKIAAIKLAVTMDRRGYVTREDFKMHGVDHRRWVPSGWVVAQGGRYTPGKAMPDFRAQHPRVYEQITAKAHEWMREVSA